MEEPLQRVLIKIDQRKRNIIHKVGYYDTDSREIFLSYPWWVKDKDLEAEVESTIEHETIHYVLHNKIDGIGWEISEKFDNIAYILRVSWPRLVFDRKMIIPRKCAKIEIRA